ncbi:hypothetical protein O181_029728 [Austropuccinia psidii MF-1]|uniref:Reverse transcriptase Ty1/copia-type domain-containing protein n=1 Tax=Austropuccinia psidii MF-1 TaxID=1389203 RepID=A0A9Q3H306_9BASI|nr:hypothetical protein [Austropuccinia psidii MF-1]
MVPNLHLVDASEPEINEFLKLKINYHSTTGSLSYLSTATRPDVSYSVSALSPFLEQPGIQHLNSFLHVLRYLKGNSNIKLTYKKGVIKPLEEYSDAN